MLFEHDSLNNYKIRFMVDCVRTVKMLGGGDL